MYDFYEESYEIVKSGIADILAGEGMNQENCEPAADRIISDIIYNLALELYERGRSEMNAEMNDIIQ